MRRVLSSAMVISGLAGLLLGVAANPAPAAPGRGAQAAAEATKVCTVKDERLRELSGIIATAKGYVVVNDSTESAANKPVFFLDAKCRFVKSVSFPTSPLDPEDLALSPDGKTVWIADIGDNPTGAERRSRVALWSMPVTGSSKPVIHRVSYPEGKPHDAEALLIADDGTPVIVTKTGGKAEIYTPTAPLKKNNETPVPLQKAGEITLPKTTTPNIFAAGGRLTVTGAARSPDGTRVALRTYADAFEWDVTGGDIVKALTTGKPRVTPLADAFGEAIAYTPDGKKFVTVSDVGALPEGTDVTVQSYVPATTVADPAAPDGGAKRDGQSWVDRLTLQDINYLIGAVGLIGAILVGAGIFGIVRARRRPVAAADDDGKPVRGTAQAAAVGPPEPGYPDAGWDAGGFDQGGQARPAGGVYGGASARPAGGVYGGAPAAPKGGAGYGGQPGGEGYGGAAAPARPAGGVYGGAAAPGRPAGGVYGGATGAPKRGGVYGGGASGRGAAPAGGGYGGPPANGGYAGGDRAEDDYRDGRGYPSAGRRDEGGHDDHRVRAYGQRPPGPGGYPDNGDGYR